MHARQTDEMRRWENTYGDLTAVFRSAHYLIYERERLYCRQLANRSRCSASAEVPELVATWVGWMQSGSDRKL